jgi:uncharacterized protein (DUF1697 family)
MPELRQALEAAGFTDVRTVLSSGNVLFTAPATPGPALERRVEAAVRERTGSAFPTHVREIGSLRRMLTSDPFGDFRLQPGSKRVVTFLRAKPSARLALPIEADGARILRVTGREVFSAYVPGPRGPVFMALIEKTFGKDVTTRTWETLGKVAC